MTHETSTPFDLKAAWERERITRVRATGQWREDEERAQQYGHCVVGISLRTSQAYRDAIAAWVYASQMEDRHATQSEREAAAL